MYEGDYEIEIQQEAELSEMDREIEELQNQRDTTLAHVARIMQDGGQNLSAIAAEGGVAAAPNFENPLSNGELSQIAPNTLEQAEVAHFCIRSTNSPQSAGRSRSSRLGQAADYEGGGLTQGTGTRSGSAGHTGQQRSV